MTALLKYELNLRTEECCSCGMVFAMPEGFYEERRRRKDSFYCPAGHSQYYLGESHEDKLRRLEREKNEAQIRLNTERIAREKAERNALKLKKRVKAGVCPCCKRTFRQLAAHMKHKHPEFAA